MTVVESIARKKNMSIESVGFEDEKSSEEFWSYLMEVAEGLPQEYMEEGMAENSEN